MLVRVTLLALIAGLVCCGGCRSKDDGVAPAKSVSDIDTQIKKVESDANMPPQAKGIVLANLQRDREVASKRTAGK